MREIGMTGGLPPATSLRATFLPIIDEATIVEAGRKISVAAPDARVILFGSHARDEADPHSDLDLLVIEPKVENAAVESVRLHRTLRGNTGRCCRRGRGPSSPPLSGRRHDGGASTSRGPSPCRRLSTARSPSSYFQKAGEDLSAAQALIGTENQADHVIGFHLQQAVEKALKAVLADRAIEIPRTHDLAYLVELLGNLGVDISESIASSDWLTPLGVLFRYDSYPDALNRDEGLKVATASIGFAESSLARPG
jgi:HEPN domain-containing protein